MKTTAAEAGESLLPVLGASGPPCSSCHALAAAFHGAVNSAQKLRHIIAGMDDIQQECFFFEAPVWVNNIGFTERITASSLNVGGECNTGNTD
jgi:hypothetical protein